MKELVQQMFWVHERGLQTLLSPNATKKITESTAAQQVLPPTESARLRIISNDHTLRTRYPDITDGMSLMEIRNMERKDELYEYAQQLVPLIVEEWEKINDIEPIAVVLYGSVAKGLVKPKDHEDPSDLDLTVIGNITREERRMLLDASIPHREKIQQQMGVSPTEDVNYPAFSCFKVRNIQTLRSDNYSLAKSLIASSAFPLHDPEGIWQKIEDETLVEEDRKNREKNRTIYKKNAETRVFDRMEKEVARNENKQAKLLPTEEEIFNVKQLELPIPEPLSEIYTLIDNFDQSELQVA